MIRLVRWKYVVPRVTIVAVICLSVWLTKNFLLRYLLVQGGQALTGAKVEIGSLQSFLSRAEMRMNRIAIADPRKPMQNLFETTASEFDVDVSELLRKRLVINEGRLSGIVLNTPRQSSGALPATPPPEEDAGPGWTDTVVQYGDQWLEGAEERFQRQLDVDLQTVQVGRELMERWPQEYQELEQRARELRERGELFAQSIKQTKQNPLQSVEHYQQLFQQMEGLRQEALQVRGRLQRVQQQMRMDRENIARAKQHDTEFVKKHLQLTRLDPDVWSNYLLGPELGGKATELLQWIEWARQYLPSGHEKPNQMLGRGWDVIFPGMRQAPNFLVRKLALDGQGQAGGNPFQFAGTVQGITSQPAVYGQPALFNVHTSGSVATVIEGVLDHTGRVPRDSIVIRCPRIVQGSKLLGKADKLAIQVAPGESALQIQLDLVGDQLQGQIGFRQPNVQLLPHVSAGLGGDLVAQRLTTATSNIRDLEAVVHLTGTLRKPSWKLQSNLGTQLASGFQTAVQDELLARQEQLMARANAEVDQAVGKLEQQLLAKQNELLQGLNLSSNQLDMIKNELSSLGLPGKLLGEGSPLQKLLKRR